MTEAYSIFSYIHSLTNERMDTTFEVEHMIYETDEGQIFLTDYKTLLRDTISDSDLVLPLEILYMICQQLWTKDCMNFTSCSKTLHFRMDQNTLWRNNYINDFNEKFNKLNEGRWMQLYIRKFDMILGQEDKLWWVISNGYHRLIPFVLQSKKFMLKMKQDPINYLTQALDNPNGLNIIRTLFDNNWNISEHMDQLLHKAASKSNKPEICQYLITKGANMEYKSNGYSICLLSSAYGKLDSCKVLIENGAKIDFAGQGGGTGLYWATRNGYADVVTYLISKGANINVVHDTNSYPLSVAIQFKKTDCAIQLINAGANLNTVSSGGTFLTMATSQGDYEVVKSLLEHGANQTIMFKNQTPLYIASELGHDKIVELLCDDGKVDVNIKCNDKTALQIAIENNHFNVAKTLVEKGANINCEDKVKGAPILTACTKNNVDIVELLCRNGVVFDIVDEKGKKIDDIALDDCKRLINFYRKVRAVNV